MVSMLTKRNSPPNSPRGEDSFGGFPDLEAADDAPITLTQIPGMIRTTSCSGTFASVAAAASEPVCRQPATSSSSSNILVALFGTLLLVLTATSAWSQHQRTLVIEGGLNDVRASMAMLTATMLEQGEFHSQSASLIHAQGKQHSQQGLLNAQELEAIKDQLGDRLLEVLAQKLAKLAPTEQLASSLDEMREKVGGLDRMLRVPAPPVQPRGDGAVHVTFRSVGAAESVAIVWLGPERADGSYDEVSYSKIPQGMQVIETTRPGECWRARDAISHEALLPIYCATIEPHQLVLIGDQPAGVRSLSPPVDSAVESAPVSRGRPWSEVS